MRPKIQILRSENLRKHVDGSGLLDAQFAKKFGLGKSYLSQLMRGTCSFSETAASNIEKAIQVEPGYLSRGDLTNQVRTVEVWDTPADLPAGVYATIPRVAITLSAGSVAALQEEISLPPLAFKEEWIRKKQVTHRDNLRVCDVSGDSMEGYLLHGDTVLIDTGQQEIVDNEIYAISYGDDLRIKRLAKRFDGSIFVRSDNPKYREEIISKSELEHVRVLGRMLWRGG